VSLWCDPAGATVIGASDTGVIIRVVKRGDKRERDWSPDDVARLTELAAAGVGTEDIVAALARTPQAVRWRAHILKVRISRQKSDPVARFWAKVDRRGPDECWPWLGCLRDQKGYGSFFDGTRNVPAHRYAFSLAGGVIPDGHDLLHSCDTPACVNHAHLSVGTHKENMADMVEKGRAARKLTDTQIADARAAVAAGERITHVARRLGVNHTALYRHLPKPVGAR